MENIYPSREGPVPLRIQRTLQNLRVLRRYVRQQMRKKAIESNTSRTNYKKVKGSAMNDKESASAAAGDAEDENEEESCAICIIEFEENQEMR